MRKPLLLLGLVFAVSLASTSVGATDFVDWTVVDTNNDVAQGTVCGFAVTLSGLDITWGETEGVSHYFDAAFFCPALTGSDVVEFTATSPAYSYTITFGVPVTDPILHIASLASTLEFSGVTLTKLCGEAEFLVSGNQVVGEYCGSLADDNGTVKVNGTVSSLSFTAFWAGCLGGTRDGVAIQIGVDCTTLPTEDSTWGRVKALYR
jgi:hypothetical protein